MKLLICESVSYKMRELLRFTLSRIYNIYPKCMHKKTCLIDVPTAKKHGKKMVEMFWKFIQSFFQIGKIVKGVVPVRER